MTKVKFFLLILSLGFIISKVLKFDSNLPISHLNTLFSTLNNFLIEENDLELLRTTSDSIMNSIKNV